MTGNASRRTQRDLEHDRAAGHARLHPLQKVPQDGLARLGHARAFVRRCGVPEENLLGPRGEGFKQFLTILDGGRISVAALSVGLAMGAYDEAFKYAKERHAFGRPISKFQAIQFKLADMLTRDRARAADDAQSGVGEGRGPRFRRGGQLCEALSPAKFRVGS